MDLVRLALCVTVIVALPVAAKAQEPWAAEIRSAARQVGLPESLLRAVLRAESAGDPRAVSRAGAMGLMQLMPGTWADLRADLGLGPDPFAPADNILAGATYLRRLYDRYGLPGAFAAYNAGPGRFDAYLNARRPLPLETRRYVAGLAVATGSNDVGAPPAERFQPLLPKGLFAIRHDREAVHSAPHDAPASGLFAVHTPRPD
ncbi:lytic transglycosylase domain-containing protein [Phenylobacterium sp.]|uniref:lytic transglycosylase domain-containing protein n=1 Tax=Phenylobacterium sp. TaxID=1871053 RepID=UPI002FC68711